jgi:maltose alpha-D-glucosyltransferase/alpha-amylase
MEKAVYELGYELNARPTWVKIPLRGIQEVVKSLSLLPATPPELVEQNVIQ